MKLMTIQGQLVEICKVKSGERENLDNNDESTPKFPQRKMKKEPKNPTINKIRETVQF